MIPTDANFTGNVFGGSILAEVDRVAYVTATRHASTRNCVTAAFDRVDFIAPVHVGDLTVFDATLTFVGHASMEVWVRVRTEAVQGGVHREVGEAYVTMVALDADGRPMEVPRLRLTDDEERHRFAEGQRRMEERRRTRPTRQPE